MADWLVPLALTVALSFVIAAPLNRLAHPLFERFEKRLVRFQTSTAHPDEIPPDLGDARALIFGMGRTGTAAYEALAPRFGRVAGLDSDPYRVASHRKAGRNAILADAEDTDFWRSVDLSGLEVVLLALNDFEAKLIAARKLRERGFAGAIISQALYAEHVDAILAAGADETYLTMHEAGISLANHAVEALEVGAPVKRKPG